MKPTHQQKQFSATRLFTDRDEAKQVFLTALENLQATDEYRVINWYGVGGQGKTALCRELQNVIARVQGETKSLRVYRHFGWGAIDFDNPTMRHLEASMLSLRLQLASTIGGNYSAFDVAFARYFALVNPGADMRKRHPELFRGDSELLGDVIDWSKEGIEASATLASIFLPGANLLYKYGARLGSRLREWWDQRGKLVLEGLDDLSADQIRQRFPTYLGADLCDHLRENSEDRLVVFLDTYEALWRNHGQNLGIAGLRVDEWVRRFVQESPGVLFVIFGRDRISWDDLNAEWSDILERHLLGVLSDNDSHRFLKAIPIENANIRDQIVQGSKGLPFFLDLQVDLYENLINEGHTPVPEQFGGSHPQILARFIDHLSNAEQQLRLASYPRILDEQIMISLIERFLGGSAQLDWKSFCSWSFISVTSSRWVHMHAIMRDELQSTDAQRRPGIFKDIHRHLASLFDDMAQANSIEELDAEKDTFFFAAAEHLLLSEPTEFPEWLRQRWHDRTRAKRYNVLLRVLELTLHTHARLHTWNVIDQIYIFSSFGDAYALLGDPKHSREYYEQALALSREHKALLEDGWLAKAIVSVCNTFSLSEIDHWEELLNEALALFANNTSDYLDEIIDCERTLGEIARWRGNTDSTIIHYERALEILKNASSVLTNEEPTRMEIDRLKLSGEVCAFLQKLDEGEGYLKTALHYADEVLGPVHPTTIDIGYMYGTLILISSRPNSIPDAEAVIQKRLRELTAIVGESHPCLTSYLKFIAHTYQARSDYNTFLEYYEKILKILSGTYSATSQIILSYECEMNEVLLQCNRHEEVISRISRIDLDQLKQEETTQLMWSTLTRALATAHFSAGNLTAAKNLMTEAIERFETFNISHHDEYIELLKGRSHILSRLGDKDAAISDSAKALKLMEDKGHPLPIVLAGTYANHAIILNGLEESVKSIEFYRKALAILDANYQLDVSNLYHQVLQGLATGLHAFGLYDEALLFQRRAFEYQKHEGLRGKENKIELCAYLMIVANNGGQFQEAEDMAEAAYLMIDQDFQGNPLLQGKIKALHADTLQRKQEVTTSRAIAEEASQLLLDQPDVSSFNLAEKVIIQSYLVEGYPEKAEDIVRARIVRMGSQKDVGWSDKAYNSLLLAQCFQNMADPQQALQICEEAVSVNRRQHESESYKLPYSLWNAIREYNRSLLFLGEITLATEGARELLAQMKAYENTNLAWLASTSSRLALLRGLEGDWSEAETLSQEALKLAARAFAKAGAAKPSLMEVPYLGVLSYALYESGKTVEALELSTSVLAIIDEHKNMPLVWELAYEAVEVSVRNHISYGRIPDACALLEEARNTLESIGIKNYVTLARYLTLSAWVYKQNEESQTAHDLAVRALNIIVSRYGHRHPYAQTARDLLHV
ncbi:MAG TPA: hypothetical protein VF527_10890 [Pyrinomonadaceae bacterium]|jgi:tetratricopeptide (TPR) repeat protein